MSQEELNDDLPDWLDAPTSEDAKGWVKLHRVITNHALYQNSYAVHLFIHCITKARVTDKTILFNGQPLFLKRGQLVIGRKSVARQTGMSERNYRTATKLLTNLGNITLKTTNRFTIVTVCNYDTYQSQKSDTDHEATMRRPRGDHEATTNKNVENVKNIIEDSASPVSKRFVPPTVEDMLAVAAERGYTPDQARACHAYYSSNGWRVGKNPMKDWKSALAGWVLRDRQHQPGGGMSSEELRRRSQEAARQKQIDGLDRARQKRLKEEAELRASLGQESPAEPLGNLLTSVLNGVKA